MLLEEAEPYVQRQAEKRAADVALLGFLNVRLPWMTTKTPEPLAMKHQTIGQACSGTHVELCRPVWGDKLATGCRSCPGVQRA